MPCNKRQDDIAQDQAFEVVMHTGHRGSSLPLRSAEWRGRRRALCGHTAVDGGRTPATMLA